MYSQFNEDNLIINYFNIKYGINYKGCILDIGANDGTTISNSKLFIEKGWFADLVEPASIPFKKLQEHYNHNPNVKLHNFAISNKDENIMFYESSSLYSKNDTGLLSTLLKQEKEKFMTYGMTYTDYEVKTFSFDSFKKKALCSGWDFISCDTEGNDYIILEQINLTEVGCKCLCIEHNGVEIEKYIKYTKKYNFRELYRNDVNIILTI